MPDFRNIKIPARFQRSSFTRITRGKGIRGTIKVLKQGIRFRRGTLDGLKRNGFARKRSQMYGNESRWPYLSRKKNLEEKICFHYEIWFSKKIGKKSGKNIFWKSYFLKKYFSCTATVIGLIIEKHFFWKENIFLRCTTDMIWLIKEKNINNTTRGPFESFFLSRQTQSCSKPL